MNKKTYIFLKLLIVVIISAVISFSVTSGNWQLPGVVIMAGASLLFVLKKRVPDVQEDERDRKMAGKAALVAMSVYSISIAVLGTTLLALGHTNSTLHLLGLALLYSTSAFVILYAILFKIYVRKEDQD